MNFEFTIGETEKHVIRYQYVKSFIITVSIYVDGKVAKNDKIRVWIPAFRRYEVEVGSEERHNVVIEQKIPRLWAKFADPECTVTIDGKFFHAY